MDDSKQLKGAVRPKPPNAGKGRRKGTQNKVTGGLYAPPSEEEKARRRTWFHETRARLTGEDLEEFDATAERWRQRGVDPETMNPDNWHPSQSAMRRVLSEVAKTMKDPSPQTLAG